eukprot:4313935-Pleurochrysis_carterae.AAC.5
MAPFKLDHGLLTRAWNQGGLPLLPRLRLLDVCGSGCRIPCDAAVSPELEPTIGLARVGNVHFDKHASLQSAQAAPNDRCDSGSCCARKCDENILTSIGGHCMPKRRVQLQRAYHRSTSAAVAGSAIRLITQQLRCLQQQASVNTKLVVRIVSRDAVRAAENDFAPTASTACRRGSSTPHLSLRGTLSATQAPSRLALLAYYRGADTIPGTVVEYVPSSSNQYLYITRYVACTRARRHLCRRAARRCAAPRRATPRQPPRPRAAPGVLRRKRPVHSQGECSARGVDPGIT